MERDLGLAKKILACPGSLNVTLFATSHEVKNLSVGAVSNLSLGVL